MHHPRLADLFEDFTRPHTSTSGASSGAQTTQTHYNAQTNSTTVTYGSSSSPTTIPSFLPVEDIYVLPQFQPPNPEDEDDVVPDQHAAFGITRAMERRREAAWRDLGLEGVVRGDTGLTGSGTGGAAAAKGKATGGRGGRVTCLR